MRICSADDCDRKHYARGYCKRHYYAFMRNGNLDRKKRPPYNQGADNPYWKGGVSRHPLYQMWAGMVGRCTCPTKTGWHRYGGRGITVCDAWRDFSVFLDDITTAIGPRPDGKSLDRIDNDGNYEPGNVRWATRKEQARNKGRAKT